MNFQCLLIFYAIVGVDITLQGGSCSKQEIKQIDTFDQYKSCYQHSFHPQDEQVRRTNFEENMGKTVSLRSQHPGTDFGVNKFFHMKHEEFVAAYCGYKSPVEYKPEFVKGMSSFNDVDWRTKGIVPAIKNQRACGSCYAFSAIGTIESQYAKHNKNLILFSEQQIVDCSKDFGNNGCNGGWMDNCYKYISEYGAMTSNEYPYIAKEDSCEYNANKTVFKLTGFKDLKSGDEESLTKAIQQIGPIAIAIDAGQPSFMMYKGGIYNDHNCSSTRLNHAVIAVGVSKAYYIVRNSWGKSWGEDGYVKIARNKDNRCGIATVASYPIL